MDRHDIIKYIHDNRSPINVGNALSVSTSVITKTSKPQKCTLHPNSDNLSLTSGSVRFLAVQPALQGDAYVNPSAPHTGSY